MDAGTAEIPEEEDEDVVHKEPTLHEIRSMLVEIQITVADIQRKHNSFVEEIATLRNSLKSKKSELTSSKSELTGEGERLQNERQEVRMKAEKRLEEIEELYNLQDNSEQYTRKN